MKSNRRGNDQPKWRRVIKVRLTMIQEMLWLTTYNELWRKLGRMLLGTLNPEEETMPMNKMRRGKRWNGIKASCYRANLKQG